MIRNTLISLSVLICGSILFIIIITIFPLIGSLTVEQFPIFQVIKDNIKLLLPLLIVSVILSPFLGWASYKIANKRFLKLLVIGLIGNWLAIILTMLTWSNFNINFIDTGSYLFLSFWGVVAYSFYSLPILVPGILIIEKWTRKKK